MDDHAQTVATRDGRQLCFAEWGAVDGVPVISMHGTPNCRLLGARELELGFEDLLTGWGFV
jgi:hypothetical protein